MQFIKRQLPLFIVFLSGMGMILCYYSPATAAENIINETFVWVQIIAAFTLIIGIYSLIRNHYLRITRMHSGWAYSVIMFVFLILTTLSGFSLFSFIFGEGGTKSKGFLWIFDNINVSATSTVFSILAFYICSAAYRAFRARNLEATIMLVTAVIIMFGRIPFGKWTSDFMTQTLHMSNMFTPVAMTDWLFNVEVMAARRAIRLGIALGIIATSMRIIFGIERSYMGGKD